MGKKEKTFTGIIRFVPYRSDAQREELQALYRKSQEQGERNRLRKEEESKAAKQAPQNQIHEETPAPVQSCQGLDDCPLFPILQQCSHLRQTLERLA